MKKAEYHVWHDVILPLQAEGHWIEPLVQIHDDLKLEFDPAILPEVHAGMKWAMEDTFEGLSLPVKTAGTVGPNWKDQKKCEEVLELSALLDIDYPDAIEMLLAA